MSGKKKKGAARKAPSPAAPGTLTDLTLIHIHYHPEAGIVRANVQQDVEFAGATQRQGRDIDIALDDLSADIRSALSDAFTWIAEDVKATPYEAPRPTEE